MKILKTLAIILLILAGIFFIGGAFLPKSHHISKSVEINTADSVAYRYVSDFANFKNWNPWYKVEPTAQTKIMGEVGKTGYTYAWSGKKVEKVKWSCLAPCPIRQLCRS